MSEDLLIEDSSIEINILDELEESLKLNFKYVRKLQMQDPNMKAIINFKESGTTGDINLDNQLRKDEDKWKMFRIILLIKVDKRLNYF